MTCGLTLFSDSFAIFLQEGSSHDRGLYARSFEELFDLSNSDATSTSRYSFSVSVFELYNEQVPLHPHQCLCYCPTFMMGYLHLPHMALVFVMCTASCRKFWLELSINLLRVLKKERKTLFDLKVNFYCRQNVLSIVKVFYKVEKESLKTKRYVECLLQLNSYQLQNETSHKYHAEHH